MKLTVSMCFFFAFICFSKFIFEQAWFSFDVSIFIAHLNEGINIRLQGL